MKNSIILESCGSKLCLESDKDLLEEIVSKDFVYEHIPSINFESGKNYNAFLTVSKENFNLSFSYPNFSYSNPQISYKDTVAFAGYILERSRQEKGFYSIHANSVESNNKGLVIFGPSNSGKTSISLNLVQNYDFGFISNERTIIDPKTLKIVGRTKKVRIDNHLKELIKSKDSYLPTEDLGNVDLKVLIYACINDNRENLKVEYYNIESAEWVLTREMDQHIRGISRRVKKGSSNWYRLPSLDTEKLANQRMEYTLKLLKNVPCLSLRGSLNKISDYITQILKEAD